MATLYDILLHAARASEALHESLATGGSTTTCIDALLTSRGWQDGAFNQGTFFFINDPNGAGEGVSRVVSGFTAASGTITLTPALAVAVEAGDTYGVMTSRYPRGVMIGKVNQTLQELGEVLSSFDIAADGSLEYALAATYKRIHRIVEGAASANPQDWRERHVYRYLEGRLLFEDAVDSGHTIRVYYRGQHPILSADTDALNTDINPDWVGLATALKVVRWRINQPGADEKALTALLNDLMVSEARHQPRRRMFREMPVNNIYPFGLPEF